MGGERGDGFPSLIIKVFEDASQAWRSHMLGFDGTTYRSIKVNGSGELVVTGGSSGGDGAILDGVTSSIKATVKDYTNSNPLAVQLMDNNGDPMSVGGGTQFAEGAALGANPVGTVAMAESSTDTAKPLKLSAAGALLTDGSAVTQPVSGTVAVSGVGGTVTVDTELSAAAALADNTVNPTTSLIGACLQGLDAGGAWDRVRMAGGVEAAALRVTMANDSTGLMAVKIDQTTPGTTNRVDTELTTADLDEGAGTDTRAVVGIVLAADGGGLLVGETNAMPVTVTGGQIVTTPSGDTRVVGTAAATVSTQNIPASVTSTTVLAADGDNITAAFYNDSTSICYLKIGSTASTTSFTLIMRAGDYYELQYRVTLQDIDAIWLAAAGSMRVTYWHY